MAPVRTTLLDRIREKLVLLYGPARAEALLPKLVALLEAYSGPRLADTAPHTRFSERDVVLITYGDLVWREDEPPLRTLYEALAVDLGGVINAVHILPFFPYSSDDGFSVIDYLQVDPRLGDWPDVERLGERFKLMFDAVINHISQESAWFQGFLQDDPAYRDFFITVPPGTDLSAVVRPRTSPLLTPFPTAAGEKHVWTTFSSDQIDLNYGSERLLLAVLDVLLRYVVYGAGLIRLDAIAYLWKEIGTSCIHLPQTHAVVQLIRDVLDAVAPEVLIITETNVPHAENISYFGDGYNEAQLVYQFSLPPLVLHSFRVGDAGALSAWARTLDPVSEATTFFNFTASHDGIGVRPAEGLITDADVGALTDLARARGGQVSEYDKDGAKKPYELNVTYVDAIIDPAADPATQARQFLASQAIMLAFAGVPGIYFHSLLGSQNWTDGVAQTGRARSINREKLNLDALRQQLADPGTLRHHIFHGYRALIETRIQERAFHPNGAQQVLDVHSAVFALRRTSPDGAARILALHNVSNAAHTITLDADAVGMAAEALHDLVSGESFPWAPPLTITLRPYQVLWLRIVR